MTKPDDLDIIRRNVRRVEGQLTDFVSCSDAWNRKPMPSVLHKCIYLHEASLRMELRPEVMAQLQALRREIAVACGIERG